VTGKTGRAVKLRAFGGRTLYACPGLGSHGPKERSLRSRWSAYDFTESFLQNNGPGIDPTQESRLGRELEIALTGDRDALLSGGCASIPELSCEVIYFSVENREFRGEYRYIDWRNGSPAAFSPFPLPDRYRPDGLHTIGFSDVLKALEMHTTRDHRMRRSY
jgi:hypothetical protein